MFSFLPLINDSVTVGLSFLLLSIPAMIVWILFCILMDCILQYFYKYHPYRLSIQ